MPTFARQAPKRRALLRVLGVLGAEFTHCRGACLQAHTDAIKPDSTPRDPESTPVSSCSLSLRASRGPSTPSVPPSKPRGNPVRTPPHRVGTASAPRWYRVSTARVLCRVPIECLSTVALDQKGSRSTQPGSPYVPPRVPRDFPSSFPQYPCTTPEYPLEYPPNTPLDRVRPRTSVRAHPHVRVEGGALGAAAADDVDGAGGVDHGRVRISRSPSRAGRAARPVHPCGRRARLAKPDRSHRTQPRARGRRRAGAGRAINTARRRRASRVRAQRRDSAHAFATHTNT
jgi:hypothetical protein